MDDIDDLSRNESISIYTKQNILDELIKRQRPDIPYEKKLFLSDMKRVCKFLKTGVFDHNKCSLWTGYITNLNSSKGTYINFYFNKKKKALHRLLFINYVDDLEDDEYVKFRCLHKGYCCSIECMYKIKFKKGLLPIPINASERGDNTQQNYCGNERDRGFSFDIEF